MFDVGIGPGRGCHGVGHSGILGWQAKGIPAHGHKHVVALHAQTAGHDIVDGVVAYMAHMQLARGVGQHRAGVVLALGIAGVVLDGLEGFACSPVGLNLGLKLFCGIGAELRWER